MLDTELQSRLESLGIPRPKARDLTRQIRDRWHPEAAVASVRIAQAIDKRNNRPSAPGLAGNTGSALQYGKMGASVGGTVGSVVPVIGTAIGTAVGAIVGAIGGLVAHKGSKPQRAAQSAQILAQLRQLPPDFSGRLFEYGDMGNPKGFVGLFQALYLAAGFAADEGSKLLDHPTSMDRESLAIIENSRRAIKGMISTPVGAPVTIRFRGANNDYGSYTFVNPGIGIGPAAIAQSVLGPVEQAARQQGGFPGQAARNASNPDFLHVAALLADKLIADNAPQNVSAVIANAPVASVPAALVANGTTLAQQVVAAGPPPALVTPAPVIVMMAPDGSLVTAPTNTPAPPGYTIVPPPPPSAPLPYGPASGYVPTPTMLNPTQDMTAGILQTQVSQQGGINMVSPPAQQVLADVATEGVTKTPAGPASGGSFLPLALTGGLFLLGR